MNNNFKISNYIKSENLKNFSIYILGAFLMKGIQFFLIPVYTSILSPEEFGQMELLNGLLTIMSIFFPLGLSTVIAIEYFHLDSQNKKKLFSEINSIYLTYIMLVLIICFILFLKLKDFFLPVNIPIIIISIVFLSSYLTFYQNVYLSILQMQKKAFKSTIYKIVIGLGSGLLILFLLYFFHFGITGIFLGNLLVMFFSLIFAFTEYYKRNGFKIEIITTHKLKTYLKMGLPFLAGTISYWVLTNLDRWIILKIQGEYQVGIFGAAYKIASILEPLVIAPVMAVYTPYIFERFKNKNLNQNLKLLTLCTIFCFAIIGFILKIGGFYLLNSKFHESLTFIPYLSISFGFFFLCQISASYLVYLKKSKVLILNIFFASVINFTLNYFLCLNYGLYGVTFASVIGNLCWFGITIYQLKKEKKKFNEINN